MRLSLALILTASMSFGCTQIPRATAYNAGSGRKTCSDIIRASADRATEQFLTGAVEIVAGLTVIGAGIAMGPDVDPNATWIERNGHLITLVPGAAVTSVGVATVVSGLSAERLASDAKGALEGNEEDRLLYYQCVKARDDWSGSHVDSTRLQLSLMKEAMSSSAAAQEASSRAQAQSLGATSVAVEARTNALRATQVATASAEATQGLASMTEKMIEAASAPPAPQTPPRGATSAAVAPKSAAVPKSDPAPATPRPPAREAKPAADAKAPAPRQLEFPSPAPRAVDRKPSAPAEEPRRAPPASPDGAAPPAKSDAKAAPEAPPRGPSSPILNEQH